VVLSHARSPFLLVMSLPLCLPVSGFVSLSTWLCPSVCLPASASLHLQHKHYGFCGRKAPWRKQSFCSFSFPPLPVRVTGSRLANYGRVEVFSNQTWVAVCDQGFSLQAARVVCRDLGYTEARPQCCSALGPPRSYSYTLPATTIGLVVNHCGGSESSLLNCNVTTTATCPSGKYASVLCSNDPVQETGELGGLPEIHHAMQKHHHVVFPCGQHHVGSVNEWIYGFLSLSF